MNLDFSEDQKLLQNTVRKFLAAHAPLEVVREALDGDLKLGRKLWATAGEMGWLGAAVPEAYGGAGLGCLELAVIAEELGRALTPIPVSSSVYLASELILRTGNSEQKLRYLPELVSGEKIGIFAVDEPHGRCGIARHQTRFEKGKLTGVKSPVLDGDVADVAVVSALDENGSPCLAVVKLGLPGVTRRVLPSIDESRPQVLIVFEQVEADLMTCSGSVETIVSQVLDRAALLVAFEQLGGAQACLDMAREYVAERFAFGRPIGSFQAPKHRLADMYTAVELARSNCYYGAWALSSENAEIPVAACMARISATEAFSFCAEENIHLHGGVGCTWEYNCHLYLRRSKLLAQFLGLTSAWKQKLIDRLDDQALTTS